MAVTARLVVAGAALDADDDAVAAVTTALAAAGAPVTARVIVEDDDVALEEALAAPSDLTIILAVPGTAAALATPAADVVRRALADVTGARLMPSEKIRAGREQAALSRGRDSPTARVQARGNELDNEYKVPQAVEEYERLSRMIEQHLVPYARSLTERSLTTGHPAVAVRTLRTAGVDLADIDARLGEWLKPRGAGGDVDVTTLPASGEVWVRLRAHAVTPSAAQDALALVEAKVVERLGDDYFGRDGETLERVVGRMLAQRSLMVSVAESCTGGLVGHRITSIPGSSAYFERGVMVYTNRAKQELLGVPEEVLRAHGAVSGQCAEAMVRGVCRLGGSACGLAVTGIAGPDGGTPTKPVGTVWVGVAVNSQAAAHHFLFDGDRAAVKWQSAQAALDLLRRALLASR